VHSFRYQAYTLSVFHEGLINLKKIKFSANFAGLKA